MAIPEHLQKLIRQQAYNRCGYCLTQQQYLPWKLEIEHIIPQSKGGSDAEDNLWLACRSCNLYKSNQIDAVDPLTGKRYLLFNPREQVWWHHFQWSNEGTMIVGLTPCGRASVIALNMNNLVAVTVRRNWVAAGWHPPRDK
ncbi:MAG: HNH endonuclease [Chloroflexota bacterium]